MANDSADANNLIGGNQMLKNEKGFTLIEMLVVLLIITVLILLIVPSLGSKTESMHKEGCDALVITVQGQADMYEFENNNKVDSIGTLRDQKYITDNQMTCKNGQELTITNGVVSAGD